MVFTTTNLFKGIACPEGEKCQLTHCIFSHDLRPQGGERMPTQEPSDITKEPAVKRRKIAADDKTGRPLSKSDQIRQELAAERKGLPGSDSSAPSLPPSLEKPVTPPPTNGRKSTNNKTQSNDSENNISTTKQSDSQPKEALNPRRIPNDPVGHQKRTLYLKHMHTDMTRLNQRVSEAKGLENKKVLHLSEQELIKMALDEEESLARNQGTLYANKAKQRVATYKKMDLEGWVTHVKTTVIKVPQEKAKRREELDEKVISTGLSLDEEVLILPHLVADQTQLIQHGYIPSPPTAAQATEAQAAIEASKHYETCDRCGTRFQVFPERNEDGLLTSNGPCRFHANKPINPPKTKNDYNAGVKTQYHPCCNEGVGSKGCTTHESHVFKCSAPARLAAVLPFETTPKNPSLKRDRHGREVKAVSFDCEMGYTTCGLELIRLTAVSWPSGEELVDVLVRPVGTIIDLNSRFSGVFPEHFKNAIPYQDWAKHPPPSQPSITNPDATTSTPQVLPLAPSIPAARALLTSYLTPSTPLIGHAIDNDLNATRLCHPTIIDTVLLFRHPRGLPYRFGLRNLALQHLGKRIQQGGEMGHDSGEDARATGELVRVKVGERWGVLSRAGWAVREGRLVNGKGGEGAAVFGDVVRRTGRKRGRFGMDGTGDESEEGEGGGKEGEVVVNGLKSFLERA